MIVKVCAVPGQPLPVGVTVIVAVIGMVPVLVAVKLAMLPVPAAAKPIAVLLLVHAYVTPANVLVKAAGATVLPLHAVKSAGSFIVTVGYTMIIKVCGVPGQALPVGVTVIVAVMSVVPVLVAVKLAMFPVPFAAKPIAVLLLVHV